MDDSVYRYSCLLHTLVAVVATVRETTQQHPTTTNESITLSRKCSLNDENNYISIDKIKKEKGLTRL